MESKLGRTCQNLEVEVTEAIGGDQDVGLDHDGQEANEGQCDQQDRGDGGDCSLHQDAMDGYSGCPSDGKKDCRKERDEIFPKNINVNAAAVAAEAVAALATAEAVAEEDKYDRDE